MNITEFAALKEGDHVVNHMARDGVGRVSKVMPYGIKVQWLPSTMEWEFTVNSTAWMHWSKQDATEPDKTAQDSPQDAPGAAESTAQHKDGA